MYGSYFTFLGGIICVILIIPFFIMGYRLKRIMNAIVGLADLEF